MGLSFDALCSLQNTPNHFQDLVDTPRFSPIPRGVEWAYSEFPRVPTFQVTLTLDSKNSSHLKTARGSYWGQEGLDVMCNFPSLSAQTIQYNWDWNLQEQDGDENCTVQ